MLAVLGACGVAGGEDVGDRALSDGSLLGCTVDDQCVKFSSIRGLELAADFNRKEMDRGLTLEYEGLDLEFEAMGSIGEVEV